VENVSDFFDTSIKQIIGEIDLDFVNNQKQFLSSINSSSKELSEDDFNEGECFDHKFKSLEELIWPPEMLLNTYTVSQSR